ncbi:hypothetical protein PAXRUDRAFT_829743 [Paxillus rubicundulus Ve08.2h10]|uniref:pH-response regulator protein palC n=1 Tax=Paxillus rubicundulus Ve08.2h10 TaxID=930991 RepID=A0A0D0D6Z5_9AGAM|nr:hypothetical protein PAXRUDRAFT_829743 [Paxillus rubicundulus Ve08.2h10]
MTGYVYELPTTGAISFAEFCIDTTGGNVYTSHIAEATQARANMRGVLKECKRMDSGERDYLRIIKVLDDYLPHVYGIIACVASGEIRLKYDPEFSWRTTLSSTLFHTSPRLRLPSLHADLASTLLTYSMALSNFSHSVVSSLGAYEYERAISEKERKDKDERLNFGVLLLCRASGIHTAIGEGVLGELERASNACGSAEGSRGGRGGWVRPPDLEKEVNAALTKMALADAQTLAIRKLLSKAAFDSTLSPGPPLPKSHPSTALIAKLHLGCAALYSSARALAMTPSKASSASGPGSGLKANFGSGSKSSGNGSGTGATAEVSADLLKYLEKETKFHTALAHKWLGVDAGESAKAGKGGEAVGFLKWAQQELEDLSGPGFSKGLSIGRGKGNDKDGDGDGKGKGGRSRKVRIEDELKSVKVFLGHYRKMNDSLTFDPVPKQSVLQALIPEGIMAVSAKAYAPPEPAFGPGSRRYEARTRRSSRDQEEDGSGSCNFGGEQTFGMEKLQVDVDAGGHADRRKKKYAAVPVFEDSSDDDDDDGIGRTATAARTYVGEGSYF